MPNPKKKHMSAPKKRISKASRKVVFSLQEQRLLKQVGLKINSDLYQKGQSVEGLSFEIGIARSSIREIIAGRSNPRLLTLNAISAGLGYDTLQEFLKTL